MKLKYSLLTTIAGIFFLAMVSCGNKGDKTDGKDSSATPLEQLNQKIAANPKVDSLYRLRAELYLSLGENEKALTDIRKAEQLNPEATKNHLVMADVYLAMGNIDYCKRKLMKAFEMDPANPEPSLKLAELNLFLNDLDKVFLYTSNALSIDEHNSQAFFIKGYALLEKKDTLKAIESLESATRYGPDNYDAFIMLGHVLELRKSSLAGGYYRTATTIQPNNVEGHYNYGFWLQENRDFEKAIAEYEKIIKIDPKNTTTKTAYALHNIGYINLVYFQKYQEAVKYFSQAVSLDPKYAEAYCNRGRAYEELKQYSKARQDYNQTLKLIENFDLAIDGLNRIEGKK
jgi:tetratricopeptide (TPR) repeat protein